MIKTIALDFDGVILDSVHIKTRGFERLFIDHPAPIREKILEYHLLHGGISRFEKIRYAYRHLIREELSEEKLQCLAQRYSDFVLREMLATSWVLGAEEFLKEHYQRFPLFVVSGTPQTELREIVKKRGMEKYFRLVLGSPTEKVELIGQALTQLGFRPQEAVMVGDAMTDYLAASQLNMPFVGIGAPHPFPSTVRVLSNLEDLGAEIRRLNTSV